MIRFDNIIKVLFLLLYGNDISLRIISILFMMFGVDFKNIYVYKELIIFFFRFCCILSFYNKVFVLVF